MKCNYKPPKLTKEEQQDMVSIKSTLPYIDRLQTNHRSYETDDNYCEDDMMWNRIEETDEDE